MHHDTIVTYLIKKGEIMKTVYVTEIGIKAKSFFLTDRELESIGTEKRCLTCGGAFKVGERELFKYSHDMKGRERRTLDVCGVGHGSEFWMDVNLSKTPIDFSKYTVHEKAIIFGVEGVNMHICPSCVENNSNEPEGYGMMAGKEAEQGADEE